MDRQSSGGHLLKLNRWFILLFQRDINDVLGLFAAIVVRFMQEQFWGVGSLTCVEIKNRDLDVLVARVYIEIKGRDLDLPAGSEPSRPGRSDGSEPP